MTLAEARRVLRLRLASGKEKAADAAAPDKIDGEMTEKVTGPFGRLIRRSIPDDRNISYDGDDL